MWPYSGKKTFHSNAGSNNETARKTPTRLNKGKCNLDKEYFNQIMSPTPGQLNFMANKIADDGRIYRCYGLNTKEITDQYSLGTRGTIYQHEIAKPSKQLHEKNVSRLKVVLSMPAKDRRRSLSQVTNAIMRNEVVPSETRLQNGTCFNDYMRTSNAKLPPLNRKTMDMAKHIEVKLRNNRGKLHRSRPPIMKYQHEYCSSDEGVDGKWLPEITCGAQIDHDGGLKDESTDGKDAQVRLTMGISGRQKSGTGHLYRNNEARLDDRRGSQVDVNSIYNSYQSETSKHYEKPFVKQVDRRDSVAQTTEAISEQFRAVIQDQMRKTKTPSENVGSSDGCMTTELSIAVKGSRDTLAKQLSGDTGRSVANGYKARHEYGKNLERNWFKNYIQKQARPRSKTQDSYPSSCGLRLDIFYSPEPESDDELNDSEDNYFFEDDTSIQCGGFSTATAETRARHRRNATDRRLSALSTDAILEEEEEPMSDDESSGSDIEIVLKENQLIQRKTRHKMRKKRKRQLKRYRTFMPAEVNTVQEVPNLESEVPLTDQEIRALRLNLRNKDRLKKLKGKRKFLQVANAVYIVAQFKRILRNIRKRKRNIIKKRQQRIANMVAKRLALKEKEEELIEEVEREPTPKPTLKEQFMNEIGQKLVFEVDKLNITSESESEDENNSDLDADICKTKTKAADVRKPYVSKFEAEVNKISLNDVDIPYSKATKHHRSSKRRNSIPKMGRPFEFFIEVPVKSKRKRDKTKQKGDNGNLRNSRRPPSPPEIKCSCLYHNKRLEANSRASFTSLARQAKCQHQTEVKKPKMKKVRVQTSGLMRTYSLDNLAKKRPIELRELLKDIDFPAKEIKLQILARKFRRQRRRRQRIRLSPCRLPEATEEIVKVESESGSVDGGSDDSDKSDYDFVYGGPFVGCGVMWHKDSKSARRQNWTSEDVDREVKKITRIFHELKECRYLRLDSFNTAVMSKLNDNKLRL